MLNQSRVDELLRRIDADPTSIAFAELAEEYRRHGNRPEAIKLCRTGLARHPAYLSARVTLGRALTEVDDLPSAQAELEQVLRVAPDSLPAIRALAEVHQRRDEPARARELLQRASDLAQKGLDLPDGSDDIARHLTDPALEEPPAAATASDSTEFSVPAPSSLAPDPAPVPDPRLAPDVAPAPVAQAVVAQPVVSEAFVSDPRVSPALAALERFLESVQMAGLRHERPDPRA